MKVKLAYVDDSPTNLECIKLILKNDFDVDITTSARDFLRLFETNAYSAILLDIHMPEPDGFELYELIIQNPHYNGCPIIFISSDDTDENRIRSFTLGAVDFLSRQMTGAEMVNRIKTKIAFFQKHRNIIEFGNLRVNLTSLKCYLEEEELKLTFIEFKLISHLIKSFPSISSKDELIDKVWCNEVVLDATIYTHICNLNQKLEKWNHEVSTARSKGIVLTKKTGKM